MTSSGKRHQHDYRLLDGCFHIKLEFYVSRNLSHKQKHSHSSFTQTKIFLVWWRHHARDINIIIGSWIVGSIKPLKFMSTAVFQTEEIFVQGNRNFLVLKMQLNNKDRHDYRLNDGSFHEFVAIHISNSFSSKQKKSAFKQI